MDAKTIVRGAYFGWFSRVAFRTETPPSSWPCSHTLSICRSLSFQEASPAINKMKLIRTCCGSPSEVSHLPWYTDSYSHDASLSYPALLGKHALLQRCPLPDIWDSCLRHITLTLTHQTYEDSHFPLIFIFWPLSSYPPIRKRSPSTNLYDRHFNLSSVIFNF